MCKGIKSFILLSMIFVPKILLPNCFSIISKNSVNISSSNLETQTFYINQHTYKQQAKNWIQNYFLGKNNKVLISPQELQLIANLIYFSFMRSYNTLRAQTEALTILDSTWKAWQNIAQTRLDPSTQAPYEIRDCEKCTLARFWQLHDAHQKMGKTYSKAVQIIVNGNLVQTVQAKNAVINLRNQARTVVAQSILDIKNYIGELFYFPKKDFLKKNALSFLTNMCHYLPQLAIHSFVKANQANDIISEESWTILMKIQKMSIQTWHTIELERASFYLAFNKAICKLMQNLKLSQEFYKIILDEQGLMN